MDTTVYNYITKEFLGGFHLQVCTALPVWWFHTWWYVARCFLGIFRWITLHLGGLRPIICRRVFWGYLPDLYDTLGLSILMLNCICHFWMINFLLCPSKLELNHIMPIILLNWSLHSYTCTLLVMLRLSVVMLGHYYAYISSFV